MEFEIIKAENPRYGIDTKVNLDLENKQVNDNISFNGDKLTIIQLGEIITLTGNRDNNQVLYVLKRIYKDEDYITDYKHITEPEHLIVNENEKLFIVKHPMSLEALFKYIRYHKPTPEPSINMVGNDSFEFVNGWRLYGSDSHKNIKAGRYQYESKVITTEYDKVWEK